MAKLVRNLLQHFLHPDRLVVSLLLRHSLGLNEEAATVEAAVHRVLEDGVRTPDIAAPGKASATTRDIGAAVVAALKA